MGESAAHSATLIGRTIGNYEVIEKLGEGGMGAVYLAQHPRIGKKVALKVLHAEFASDANIVDRFFTEAKSVNDIGHPNIVDIIDYGEMPGDDGKPVVYFFMEFLEGESIAELVSREAPIPPERVFPIAAQIADALGASHMNKVVHRDLKPDNIFLVQRGRMTDRVKVLDFGIAKLTGDQPGSRRTRTGIVIGTPYYMSPEQCEGKGNIDRRTDVYALGIVMFEMLTKHVPFDGEGYGEILVQHLTQVPPRPTVYVPNMSPYVEVIVLKALEKHRDDRYQSMEEFRQALVDPVNYVNAHGGPAGFLSGGAEMRLDRKPGGGYISPTTASGRTVNTPPPMNTPVPMYTPPPGDQSSPFMIPDGQTRSDRTPFPVNTPMPYVPTPTPAGSYDPSLDKPPKSKLPLLIAGGVVAGAIAVTLAMTLGGGGGGSDGEPAAAAGTAETANPEGATGAVVPEQPAAPQKISIRITTRPEGAGVFVGDETEPRGQTPFDLQLDKAGEPVKISLRKDGFEEDTRDVTPDRDAIIDLSMTATPKVAEDDSKKKTRRSSRSKTHSSDDKKKKKKKRSKVGDDILVPDL